MVDYPILAYKSISPDNREIVISHLSHNIPQRLIHLRDWEFVSFVKGNFEDADLCKQVMLLVKNRKENKIKLIVISIDPWKAIEFYNEFDIPENIFFVKNSNISFPRSIDDPTK